MEKGDLGDILGNWGESKVGIKGRRRGCNRDLGVTPVALPRAKGREGPPMSWVVLARLPGWHCLHHPDTSK